MCSLSVVRNLNNKHTPSDILLLMFILHTFMGALSKSKMCWKWSKDLTESPHYYYHYYCLKISPLASSGLVKCLTYIFIQDKVSHNDPLLEKRKYLSSILLMSKEDTPPVVDWNPFRIHNYVCGSCF